MDKHLYGYGPHLMLDLNDCNPLILDDLEICFGFLNDLPSKIGMTKITQPHVFRYNAPDPRESGITGVTIIAESHLSLHTYPKKSYAFVDLFSCKGFDIEAAKDHVIRTFQSRSPEYFVQRRGEAFPSSFRLAS